MRADLVAACALGLTLPACAVSTGSSSLDVAAPARSTVENIAALDCVDGRTWGVESARGEGQGAASAREALTGAIGPYAARTGADVVYRNAIAVAVLDERTIVRATAVRLDASGWALSSVTGGSADVPSG